MLRANEGEASVGAYLWITGRNFGALREGLDFFFHLLANKHARTLLGA